MITNLDLELTGLIILWLIMEHVCGSLAEKRVALFSDNNPTVSWVQRIACCSSLVAEQLVQVLALRFNIQKVSPITMLHIAGDKKFDDQYSLLFVWEQTQMAFQIRIQLTNLFQVQFHCLSNYPPHAVVLLSLTNLGPVARLELEIHVNNK